MSNRIARGTLRRVVLFPALTVFSFAFAVEDASASCADPFKARVESSAQGVQLNSYAEEAKLCIVSGYIYENDCQNCWAGLQHQCKRGRWEPIPAQVCTSKPSASTPKAAPAASQTGDSYISDKGCKVLNRYPKPDESITWSGKCKNGFADGPGVVVWYQSGIERSRVSGSMINGRYEEGVVESTRSSGDKFKTIYEKGKRISASESFANGKTGEYEFKDGELVRGQISYASGNRYVGEVHDWLPHGQGIYYYADGGRYEGEVKEGKKVRGTMYFADGARYEGHYEENQFNGPGKYTSADGSGREGQFFGGKLAGYGKLFNASGSRWEGVFVDGEAHGIGTTTMSDGKSYPVEFDHGKRVKKNQEAVAASTTSRAATRATQDQEETARIEMERLESKRKQCEQDAQAVENVCSQQYRNAYAGAAVCALQQSIFKSAGCEQSQLDESLAQARRNLQQANQQSQPARSSAATSTSNDRCAPNQGWACASEEECRRLVAKGYGWDVRYLVAGGEGGWSMCTKPGTMKYVH